MQKTSSVKTTFSISSQHKNQIVLFLLHKDLNFMKGFCCNLTSSSYQRTGSHGS